MRENKNKKVNERKTIYIYQKLPQKETTVPSIATLERLARN